MLSEDACLEFLVVAHQVRSRCPLVGDLLVQLTFVVVQSDVFALLSLVAVFELTTLLLKSFDLIREVLLLSVSGVFLSKLLLV